jgi:hypothetical protein
VEVEMINELVDERGKDYGRAWFLESLVWGLLNDYHTNERELKVYYSDYQGPWRAIMAKMLRLAETPDHVDSWADVEGYAKLARRHIEDGVWHGEAPRKKAKFTAQCTQTFSSVDVPDIAPVSEWKGTLDSDGDGGLVIKDMVEVEVERAASEGSDFHGIIWGMATEDVRAGDIVRIATGTEVEE